MPISPNGFRGEASYIGLTSEVSNVKLSSEVTYTKLTADILIELTGENIVLSFSDGISTADLDSVSGGVNIIDTIFAKDVEIVIAPEVLNGSVLNHHGLGNQTIPPAPDTAITVSII